MKFKNSSFFHAVIVILLGTFSIGFGQQVSVSKDQLFQLGVAIIGGLIAIISSISVAELKQIRSSGKSVEEKITEMLVRMTILENSKVYDQNAIRECKEHIEKLEEKMVHKCSKEDCPYREETR